LSHPVTGFQVVSVHSIALLSAKVVTLGWTIWVELVQLNRVRAFRQTVSLTGHRHWRV